MIKINDLQNWIIDYVYHTIHNLESDNLKFNEWAKSFERAEADFVVSMDLWELEEVLKGKTEVSEEEAEKLAHPFIQKIIDHWYFRLWLQIKKKEMLTDWEICILANMAEALWLEENCNKEEQ